MKVVILSNSHGEDWCGSIIGRELKRMCPELQIVAYPLISSGMEYVKRGIDCFPGAPPPPSGGFLLKSFTGFIKDILNGFQIPFKYIEKLRKEKDETHILLVVGDVPLLLMGYLSIRKKAYFFGICKSDYMSGFLSCEIGLMKRFTLQVITRDPLTADNLSKKGVSSVYLGNPMMDDLFPEGVYKSPEGVPVIGILPGSRKEAYGNLERILKVIEVIKEEVKNAVFPVAIAGTLDYERMLSIMKKGPGGVIPVKNGFVDVVLSSHVILSLAGTATEQAAGLGKPVIAFTGTGPQTTYRRLLGQKNLLGDAIEIYRYNPEMIAERVVYLLKNPELGEKMGMAGKERMGSGGGGRKIAEFILRREGLL